MKRVPVTILTGFLGSGKTTLLNRLMAEPSFGDTAVIVNEFGEAGLDGALIEHGDGRAFAMSTGCLCCTIRGDVRLTLLRLLDEAERGVGPRFSRIVIETTGLADPAPVLQTFMTNDFMLSRFTLNGVVTLVDAVAGLRAVGAFEEAMRQVCVADLLLVTKTELLGRDAAGGASDFDYSRLRELNPNARVMVAGEADAETVFSLAAFDPSGKPPDVCEWLRFGDERSGGEASGGEARCGGGAEGHEHGHEHGAHSHDVNAHGETASAYCFSATGPIDPGDLNDGVTALQRIYGADLLRIKGIVELAGRPNSPRVLHVVGHVVGAPRLMDGWPDGLDATRIVVIVSGPGRDAAPDMLRRFVPQLRAFDRGSIYEEVAAQ